MKHNFGAGPGILPQEVLKQAGEAAVNFNGIGLSILEISHRSTEFEAVLDEAVSLVKELLNVPEGYSLSVRVPMDDRPWLGLGLQDAHSAEHNWGVPEQDLQDGSEKYILRDGLQCLLVYPTESGPDGGKMWFEVPIRPSTPA